MKVIDNLVSTIINKTNTLASYRPKKLDTTGEQSSMAAKVQRVSNDSYIAHRIPTWLARDVRLHLANTIAETKYKSIFGYEYLEDLHRTNDNVLAFPISILPHKYIQRILGDHCGDFCFQTKGQMAKTLSKIVDRYSAGYPEKVRLCNVNEYTYYILFTGGKDMIIMKHDRENNTYRLQPILISVCDVDPINITNYRFMYCNDVKLPEGEITSNFLWIMERVALGLVDAGNVVEFVSMKTMMTKFDIMTKFETNDSDQ